MSTQLISYQDFLNKFNVQEYLPPHIKAHKLWNMLLVAKRSRDGLFLVIGKILKQIRDEKLYKDLDYPSFSKFLSSEEISFSRETAYMYIKTYEYYIEYLKLNPEEVGRLNVAKLSRMVPYLKRLNDPEKAKYHLKRLAHLRFNDFIKELKPKNQRSYKPTVYYDFDLHKWVVKYYSNKTAFIDLGEYDEESASLLQEDIENQDKKEPVF